jgi:hypothetical protein
MIIRTKYISVVKLIQKVLFLLVIVFCLQHKTMFAATEAVANQGTSISSTAPDIYQLAENNGIASGMCRALDFMNFVVIPISAMMFVILGYNGLKGNLNYSSIVTFAIAIGAMRGAGTLLEIYLPGRGLKYGCKCAKYVITARTDSEGRVIREWKYNKMHENCVESLTP